MIVPLILAAWVPALTGEAPPPAEPAPMKEERGLRYVASSPDGRWKVMVFGLGRTSGAGWDDSLWAERVETGEMTCLVGRSCPAGGEQWGLTQLAFGVDEDELFLVGGPGRQADQRVHRVDLATGNISFVAEGSAIHVIRTGFHRGKLVIRRNLMRADADDAVPTNTDTDLLIDRSGRILQRLPNGPSGDVMSDGYSHWLRENGWE